MKISFQNISKQYKGKYALKNFTTESQEGVYGLLGVNSTGKTTLINIFVGTLGSDNGTVLIDGQEAKTLGKEFLSKIGYMMQYSIFYRDFTVMDFLLYMCTLKGIFGASRHCQSFRCQRQKDWRSFWRYAAESRHCPSDAGRS